MEKTKNEEITVARQALAEHKQLKQNGYSIHYYTSGQAGKVLIVWLHPAFADHRCFDYQVEYFGKNYRVITLDMLGHGLSAVMKAKDKIDATVQHIDKIIQLEGYTKAHFVGVSMGSLVAQYYALQHPEKVSSLTVVGGYDISADNSEVAKAQRAEQVKWIFKAIFSMNSFRRYVSVMSAWKPAEQERIYEQVGLFTRKSFMAMSGLGKILKPRPFVSRSYPLLIVCGEKDNALAIDISHKWHKAEPQSTLRTIPDAGHCAQMDNPEGFNKVLQAFFVQPALEPVGQKR